MAQGVSELTRPSQVCRHSFARLAEAPTRTPPDMPPLGSRLGAEGVGSFFLFACVIGSGIMAENLSGGNFAGPLTRSGSSFSGKLERRKVKH